MYSSAFAAGLLVWVTLASAPCQGRCHAQDAAVAASADAQSTIDSARVHFERGVERYSEGDYDAALAELRRAYALRPNYKLLFNLAQVQVELHDNAAALQLFNQYLQEGSAEITPERASEVQRELERLRQSVAEISVDVDIAGARISIDAVPVGTSPLREPLIVNAGSARVSVEKAGYVPFAQSLSVASNDHPRLTVVLAPLSAATTTAPQPALSPSALDVEPNMTPFWISLGSTLVLGGATATFAGLSLHAHGQQDDLLASYPGRPRELAAARDRLQTFAVLTDVFAGATLVAGIVSVYFALSPPERREPATQASLRLGATPSGVLLTGAF